MAVERREDSTHRFGTGWRPGRYDACSPAKNATNSSSESTLSAGFKFAGKSGRRREVNIREVLNAIFYVLSTGCQWQALPKDLPPKSTAHSYFMLWDWDGTLERAHHALYVATREREGREASPTAAIIDSQSAKAAQKGAPRLTRRALMRPRRSPAANGVSWSTRSACC